MMATALVLPKPGDRIAGKYALVRVIGQGGMGLVFEARHRRLGTRVAIKFLHAGMVLDSDAVSRFEREGRHASRVTGPHAARIFDVDVTPTGIPYIVSEYLKGNDLEREISDNGPLPIVQVADYVRQACVGMSEAHAMGIVHRDLKPSNVFLVTRPRGRIVKILDFGISKVTTTRELDLTSTGMILGSPRYLAPEQLVDVRTVDPRADIWSLGVVLYRALTGNYPFDGANAIAIVLAISRNRPEPVLKLRPEMPPALAAVVERALAKDPDERYQTMAELAEALAPFGSGPTDPALFEEQGRESLPPPATQSTNPPPLTAAPSALPLDVDATAAASPAARRPTSGARRRRVAAAGIGLAAAIGAAWILGASSTPVPHPSVERAAPPLALATASASAIAPVDVPTPAPVAAPSPTPRAAPPAKRTPPSQAAPADPPPKPASKPPHSVDPAFL